MKCCGEKAPISNISDRRRRHKMTGIFKRCNTVDAEDARTARARFEGFLLKQSTAI